MALGVTRTGSRLAVGQGGRHDSPERQDAEELAPARIAAVGGEAQPALQCDEKPPIHAPCRDVLQVKIPAPGAVHVERKGQRHTIGVEPPFARVAAPGQHAQQRRSVIERTVAVRAKTV